MGRILSLLIFNLKMWLKTRLKFCRGMEEVEWRLVAKCRYHILTILQKIHILIFNKLGDFFRKVLRLDWLINC